MGDHSYPSSARKAQTIFATTAARSWTANSPAPPAAGERSFSAASPASTYASSFSGASSSQTSRMSGLKEHHHKRSAFALGAKFHPALWEQPMAPEQKVEAELAGWNTDRSAHGRRAKHRATSFTSPAASGSSFDSYSLHDASLSSSVGSGNPYLKSAQLIRSPMDELDVLASRGYRAADLVGLDQGVPFPLPPAQGTRVAATQTESWGEYGSAVTRIQQLAGQVKHLYAVNQTVEGELQKKAAEVAQARRETDAVLANQESLTRTMLGRQAEYERVQGEYAALRRTRDDSAEVLAKLRRKAASQKAHIQAQEGALGQMAREKEAQAVALDYAALESEKLEEAHRQVRQLKEERQRMAEEYAHALEVDRQHTSELALGQAREDDLRRSLESSQRLLDEHVRQSSLDAQHLLHLKATMDLRLSERDRLVEEQDRQLMRLRQVEVDAEKKADPMHADNQVVASTLEQARNNVRMLEEYNLSLKERLFAAEKMVNDLLTSSTYRREVLVKKEKALPPEERARADADAKKKSSVCAIM